MKKIWLIAYAFLFLFSGYYCSAVIDPNSLHITVLQHWNIELYSREIRAVKPSYYEFCGIDADQKFQSELTTFNSNLISVREGEGILILVTGKEENNRILCIHCFFLFDRQRCKFDQRCKLVEMLEENLYIDPTLDQETVLAAFQAILQKLKDFQETVYAVVYGQFSNQKYDWLLDKLGFKFDPILNIELGLSHKNGPCIHSVGWDVIGKNVN